MCQPVRDADGEVTGILLYASPMSTAHVQSRVELEETAAQLAVTEERLRGLFETMPQGVIRYAADGSVIGADPARTTDPRPVESEMTTWPLANAGGRSTRMAPRSQPEDCR